MKFFCNLHRFYKDNKIAFYTVIFTFILGIVAGSYYLIKISDGELNTLKNNIEKNFYVLIESPIDCRNLFFVKLKEYSKLFVMIILSGLSVFLLPVIFVQLFLKGFRIGFTIAFLSGVYKIKGIIGALINFISYNMSFLPIIFFLSVFCIRSATKHKKKQFFSVSITCFIIMILLSFFESYIVSNISKVFLNILL